MFSEQFIIILLAIVTFVRIIIGSVESSQRREAAARAKAKFSVTPLTLDEEARQKLDQSIIRGGRRS